MAAPRRLNIGSGRKRLGRGALTPKVTVHGLTESRKELNEAAKKVKDLRKALKIGALDIDKLMADSWRNQVDPAGVAWAPLAESTMRAKVGKSIGGRSSRYKSKTLKTEQGSFRVKVKQTPAQRALATRRRRFSADGTYKKSFADKAYKAVFGGGVKILVDTGDMLRRRIALVKGKRTIEFGNGMHYALYHQTGTSTETTRKKRRTSRGRFLDVTVAGKRVMPARKWAPVELVGKNRWQTIKTGPAKALWDKLADTIGRFVLHGNNEPELKL